MIWDLQVGEPGLVFGVCCLVFGAWCRVLGVQGVRLRVRVEGLFRVSNFGLRVEG